MARKKSKPAKKNAAEELERTHLNRAKLACRAVEEIAEHLRENDARD